MAPVCGVTFEWPRHDEGVSLSILTARCVTRLGTTAAVYLTCWHFHMAQSLLT
jgi:hypothetical protein